MFAAAAPMSLTLEIEYVGTQVRKYETPTAPHDNTLIVTDEEGHLVPYWMGWSQFAVRWNELGTGVPKERKAFDLSESFYQRRSGR